MTLRVKDITKSYRDILILRGLTLSFDVGEVTGILGPNGAGKTTLFSILTGIVKPDSGTITLNNLDITKYPIHIRSKHGIVYLPQDSSIFRGLSVRDNIRAILELTIRDKKLQEQRLNDLMEKFSISHLQNAKAPVLSGGERRKVEIARAIAANPKFLLLDEPFSGIDPISVGEITHIIELLKNMDIGVIITDHNVRETLKIIDKGYIIAGGRVIAKGTADEIKNDEQTKNLYLGHSFEF